MEGANCGWGGGEKNPPPFPPHIPPLPPDPPPLSKPATQASTDVQGTTPESAIQYKPGQQGYKLLSYI